MTYCVACRWANRPHHTRRDRSSTLSYHIKLRRWTTYQQQNPHVLPVFLSQRKTRVPLMFYEYGKIKENTNKIKQNKSLLLFFLFACFNLSLWYKKKAPFPGSIPASCSKNSRSMNKKRQNSLTLKRQVIAVQCFHVKPWVTLKCKGPLRGQRVGGGDGEHQFTEQWPGPAVPHGCKEGGSRRGKQVMCSECPPPLCRLQGAARYPKDIRRQIWWVCLR